MRSAPRCIDPSWIDRSDNESRFCIEQLSGSWTQLATVGANSTNYSFRLRAHTEASSASSGYSAYSDSGSAMTFPAAPTGLTATAMSSTPIDLTWNW